MGLLRLCGGGGGGRLRLFHRRGRGAFPEVCHLCVLELIGRCGVELGLHRLQVAEKVIDPRAEVSRFGPERLANNSSFIVMIVLIAFL